MKIDAVDVATSSWSRMDARRHIASDAIPTATRCAPHTPRTRFWHRVGHRDRVYNRRMSSTATASSAVGLGIDRLLDLDRALIAGRRIGLVCNPASVDGTLRHTADRLGGDPEVTVAALFGPQHGFRSDLQDNMIETPHARDARRRDPGLLALQRDARADAPRCCEASTSSSSICRTSAPASTPSSTRWPTACAPRRATASGRRLRPAQPGRRRRGRGQPAASRAYASFVGQFPIPLRHGLTIGELARLFNDEFGIGCALDVVPLEGWRRGMYFDETGAAVGHAVAEPADARQRDRLSGRGAVRGHALSEGRGTTRPFELIGAPWIDGDRLADAMNARGLPGRALPAGVLRADVPEAREADLRRLPDARRSIGSLPSRCERRSS